jgi:hypothetical protein
VRKLVESYRISRKDAETDLDEFVDELVKAGILNLVRN